MTPAAGISGPVMAAVLCAALMHAGWNALVKARGDAFLSTVLVTASAGILCLLALPFLPQPLPASWPFIAASSLTQVLYYALLMETYRDLRCTSVRAAAPPARAAPRCWPCAPPA